MKKFTFFTFLFFLLLYLSYCERLPYDLYVGTIDSINISLPERFSKQKGPNKDYLIVHYPNIEIENLRSSDQLRMIFKLPEKNIQHEIGRVFIKCPDRKLIDLHEHLNESKEKCKGELVAYFELKSIQSHYQNLDRDNDGKIKMYFGVFRPTEFRNMGVTHMSDDSTFRIKGLFLQD